MNHPLFSLPVTTALALGLLTGASQAAPSYFRPEAEGGVPVQNRSYEWNTTSAFWYDTASGGTAATWSNTAPSDAYFHRPPATYHVLLTEAINVTGIYGSGGNPTSGLYVHISSSVGAVQTLTFSGSAVVNYFNGFNRNINFSNLQIDGNVNIVGGAIYLKNIAFNASNTVTVSNVASPASASNINLEGGISNLNVHLNGGGLVLASSASTITRLSGEGLISRITAGVNGILTLNQAGNTTFQGNFATHSMGFTKSGAGTIIFDANKSNHTGLHLNVTGGGLYLSGTYTADTTTQLINISGGANFGGSVTSHSSVVLLGATSKLTAGLATLDGANQVVEHAGTLTLAGGVSATEGGVFNFQLDEDDGSGNLLNSRINITGGAVSLAGSKIVNLIGLGGELLEGDVAYTLFDASGAASRATGWDSDWSVGLNTTGLDVKSFEFVGNELQVTFIAQSIPEPGSFALLSLVGAAGLLRRTRRKAA